MMQSLLKESARFDTSGLWSKLEAARENTELDIYERLILGLLYCRAMSQSDSSKPEISACWSSLVRAAEPANKTTLFKIEFAAIAAEIQIDAPHGFPAEECDDRVLRNAIMIVDAIVTEAGHSLSSVLPEVFSFCVRKFTLLRGRTGGELSTPESISKLLVALASPREGIIYDPCAGSGSLLVDAWNFVTSQNCNSGKIQLFGQESDRSAWRAAKMNLIMRGVPVELGAQADDVFRFDHHLDLKAACILTDPPFNNANWRPATPVAREWKFGAPPPGNANFAWIQHVIQHLAPDGVACFTMANASLSSRTCGEAEIRRKIVEANLLDCIVALPGRLFPTSRVSACIWILNNDRRSNSGRKRHGETLFLDAQQMGRLKYRTERVLDVMEIETIAGIYHAWRGAPDATYENVPGLCRSVAIDEVAKNQFQLTPARYVGMTSPERDDLKYSSLQKLMERLNEQIEESNKLDRVIRARLGEFAGA